MQRLAALEGTVQKMQAKDVKFALMFEGLAAVSKQTKIEPET
jgi:hypothetical protein